MDSDISRCPCCSESLTRGYLYVRGFGAALSWGNSGEVHWLSRRDLEQINLGHISEGGTGTQSVIEAYRCTSCKTLSFRYR